MPLPEPRITASLINPGRIMLRQELRNLLATPSFWLMLMILSPLAGYSFFQAVRLYSQASQTALAHPQLASGMDPMAGIFVPTMGGYYLSQSLLLPFVAIRLLGMDLKTGNVKLLLQSGVTPLLLVSVKTAVLLLAWMASLAPLVLLALYWLAAGGHLHWPEMAMLLLGHGLFSFLIITLSMFAVTLADSLPSAAIFCLAVTLGSWVLDFAATSQSGLMALLGRYSLTAMLHRFETGLLATDLLALFLALALFCFFGTVIWLFPGLKAGEKLRCFLAVAMACLALAWMGHTHPRYLDATEARRHSLGPAYENAFGKLDKPLIITVHLAPQDSRLHDLRQNILDKLARTIPKLGIHYPASDRTGLFDQSGDDRYGLLEFQYGEKRARTYSNSSREILDILCDLAEISVQPVPASPYPGYPLVLQPGPFRYLFFFLLPLIFSILALYGRFRSRLRELFPFLTMR